MISVLVYGRNDTRGYGMHKRVAISLNTIAQVLSAPTSEIIFVDYNTPNHLPTLPELIRDMLTEKARLRTRVLRVRPHVHARFAPYTPLPVLEPIARNIALRRSRPQNRWILSSNTDAILVLPSGRSLCDIVRDLPDVHYGTPRFELPERLWEALDRRDPAGTIATVADWGIRVRLNEIVRGQGAVQFDNPGDFQLVRRQVMFAIDGFDEEALLGWHNDHNLTHRLQLIHGPEGDLSDHVRLYHCAHARQATATHSHDRIENDVQRFVHDVRDAPILRQRDVWGCIDDPIGEVDLREPTALALLDAIEDTVTPLAGASLSASYTSAAFDGLWYDAGHTAVYLMDLLSTFPRGVTVGLAACRRDIADILARGLEALGFTKALVLPQSVAQDLGIGESRHVTIWPDERFVSEVDVPVFEFGLARDGDGVGRASDVAPEWTDSETAALEGVAALFNAVVQEERLASDLLHQARMIVTVNAVNSRFEPVVAASLGATPSPFTTRLRFGTVSGREAEGAQAVVGAEAPQSDLLDARLYLSSLLSDGFDTSPLRFVLASYGPALRTLVASGQIPLPPGVSTEDVLARLDIVQAPAPEYSVMPRSLPDEARDESSLSRLARLSDFDSPAWQAAARRLYPMVARGKMRRDGWIWERAQLLLGLERSLPRGVRNRALLVVEYPDDIAPALADMFAHLDLLDVRTLGGAEPASMQRTADFTNGHHLFSARMAVADAEALDEAAYDAVIIPQNAAFRAGVSSLGSMLGHLRKTLRAGGVLAISGEVSMTGVRRGQRPGWSAAGEGGFPQALGSHAALHLMSPDFNGIAPAEAALTGTQADLADQAPVIAIRRDDDVFWPATWFFEASTGGFSIHRLDAGLASAVMGDQLDMMTLSERAIRNGRTIRGQAGLGDGYVFFGPYCKLPEGRYEVVVEVSPGPPGAFSAGPIRLVAEVSAGPDIVVQQEFELDVTLWDRPVLFQIPFGVSRDWAIRGDDPRALEIRLWSNGNAACDVTAITLGVAGQT